MVESYGLKRTRIFSSKLEREEHDIDGRVEREKDDLRRIKEETIEWLENVKKLKEDLQAELLDPEKRKGRDKCCFQRFRCNLIQRYQMSKTAEVKVGAIRGAIEGKPTEVAEPVSRRDLTKKNSREKLKEDILKMLQDKNVHAIGIHGMGAIGKTMLVKEIADHWAAKPIFGCIIMVEVSDFPNVVRIQDQIAKGVNKKLDGVGDERAKKLHFNLGQFLQRKTLIILDNVQKKVDLSKVGIPLSEVCKVLVTSRESKVCIDMGISKGHIRKVEPLNNDEAKQLFRQVIGKQFDDDTNEALEERLLEKCGGLPVSIVALGNLMKNQEPSIWEHLATQLEKPAVSNSPADITDDVDNSLLKTEEKEMLLFLRLACLFPDGASIPIEEMMRYGVGLNLFKHADNLIEAIEQANIWVDQLKSSSFLLQDDDRKDHVKIHDRVRASTMSQAEKGMPMLL